MFGSPKGEGSIHYFVEPQTVSFPKGDGKKMQTEKINANLIWDYQFNAEDYETDAFKEWYIARVLTRGNMSDIKKVGLENIYRYLPAITIPLQIREFWEWFFSLPDIEVKYEHIDQKPTKHTQHRLKSTFFKG